MFASNLDRRLRPRGIHYAWPVAGMTFLVMLTTAAALGMPGVLLVPLTQEVGWNAEQISGVLALRFLLFGLMAPFSAMLIERFGMVRVVCTALGMIAAAMLLSTRVTALWQLFVVWGLVLGIGSGMTAMVLAAIVANRWFEQRRGLVIGILTASSATGQLIFMPFAAWLSEHFGWRAAVLPVAWACAVLVVLVACFMRNRPVDLGLRPFGAPDDQPLTDIGKPMPLNLAGPLKVLAEACRTRTFWVLAGTFFICGLSTNGLIQTHFIAMCGDFGLAPVPAASLLALMGAFDFVGTIASGWLSDRYDSRKLLFWYYGLRGLSLFWLPESAVSLVGLSLFAMFYGLDWIATVPPTVKLAASGFGRERAALVFGWIFATHQLGAAAATYGAGFSKTYLASYVPALYVSAGACLVAALVVFLIPRPERPRGEQAAGRPQAA